MVLINIGELLRLEGHGERGGLARVAALRRRLEEERRQPVIVLFSGDPFQPGSMQSHFGGAATTDCLGLFDGDDAAFDPRLLATLGGDPVTTSGGPGLLERIKAGRFMWITSNMSYVPAGGGPPQSFAELAPNASDAYVLDAGGVRLGVFSICSGVDEGDVVHAYGPQGVPRSLVKRRLAELHEQGADVIVALTRQDMQADLALAEEFPQIQLILGGGGRAFASRMRGKSQLVATCDCDASRVWEVEIERSVRGSIELTPVVRDLEQAITPADPAVACRVQSWRSKLEALVRAEHPQGPAVYATAKYPMEGTEPAMSTRETEWGDLLADVARSRMQAEVAIVDAGSFVADLDLPAGGELTMYVLDAQFASDEELVRFELTGDELLDVLRNSVSAVEFGDDRFLQVSGLRFEYDSELAAGPPPRTRVVNANAWRSDLGRFDALAPSRRYTVAAPRRLWWGGARKGYGIFAGGAGGTSPNRTDAGGIGWRAAMEEALLALPEPRTVAVQVDGRIARTTADR